MVLYKREKSSKGKTSNRRDICEEICSMDCNVLHDHRPDPFTGEKVFLQKVPNDRCSLQKQTSKVSLTEISILL